MMTKDARERSVGSGITEYRVTEHSYPVTFSGLEAAVRAGVEFSRDPFRNTFGRNVSAAQARLKEIRAEPHDEIEMFAEHSGEGWYCQRIDVEYRRALRAAEDGEVQRAMNHAAKVGWYISEWTIKFAVERFALAGIASSEGGSRGGRARGTSDAIRDRQAVLIKEYKERLGRMDAPTAKRHAAKAAGYSVRQASRILKRETISDS
jgi:hypothetical protein